MYGGKAFAHMLRGPQHDTLFFVQLNKHVVEQGIIKQSLNFTKRIIKIGIELHLKISLF
jgi:hypothetical protein